MAYHPFMLPRKTTSYMETCPTPHGRKTLRPLPTHGVMANCLALLLHKFWPLLRKSPLYSQRTKSHRGPRTHFPPLNTSLCHHTTEGPRRDALGCLPQSGVHISRGLGKRTGAPRSSLIARDGSICISGTSAPPKTPDGCNWW